MDYTIAEPGHERSRITSHLINLIGWVVGILVALVVSATMITGTLTIKFVPQEVVGITGWVIALLTILSAILSLMSKE